MEVRLTQALRRAQLRIQSSARAFVEPNPPPRLLRNLNKVTLELSPTEKKYLVGSSLGLTDRMIADTYGVDIKTVRYTLDNARIKLQARTKVEAIAIAMRTGQIE